MTNKFNKVKFTISDYKCVVEPVETIDELKVTLYLSQDQILFFNRDADLREVVAKCMEVIEQVEGK